MASQTGTWQICAMTAAHPDILEKNCLNVAHSGTCQAACTRCRDRCPADAIALDEHAIPRLDASACTGCTACVAICPSDAIVHQQFQPGELLQMARDLVMRGQTKLSVPCSAVSAGRSGLKVPCHAIWDPMLLACLAAEGVQTLHPDGIDQCNSCPVRHGAEMMRQTEKDYAMLNRGLGVRLAISWEKRKPEVVKTSHTEPEPSRRAFFRNFIPSLTQGAAMAAAQIGKATSEAIRQESTANASDSNLPVRLRLFLSALPRLQANFTPVPVMPSLLLGAIQADARCTACNRCVEQCPTQALSIREFGANKVLEFQPDACIGCRLCTDLCPEHALETLPAISLPTVLARRARPLVMVRNKVSREGPD
jgi:ferredoxin